MGVLERHKEEKSLGVPSVMLEKGFKEMPSPWRLLHQWGRQLCGGSGDMASECPLGLLLTRGLETGPWPTVKEEERGRLAAASFCLQQDSKDSPETVVRVTRPPTL